MRSRMFHPKRIARRLFSPLCLTLLLCLPISGWADSYTVVDLGTLAGYATYGIDINNLGQVTGNGDVGVGGIDTHAFLYSDGTMMDLGTLGGDNSYASSINNLGQVVGYSEAANGQTHAFLYSGGMMTDLGSSFAGNSYAMGINDSGQIVEIGRAHV